MAQDGDGLRTDQAGAADYNNFHSLTSVAGVLSRIPKWLLTQADPTGAKHFQNDDIKHIFNETFHQPSKRSQSHFFNQGRRSRATFEMHLMRPIATSRFARQAN